MSSDVEARSSVDGRGDGRLRRIDPREDTRQTVLSTHVSRRRGRDRRGRARPSVDGHSVRRQRTGRPSRSSVSSVPSQRGDDATTVDASTTRPRPGGRGGVLRRHDLHRGLPRPWTGSSPETIERDIKPPGPDSHTTRPPRVSFLFLVFFWLFEHRHPRFKFFFHSPSRSRRSRTRTGRGAR